jgi:hypothetical protein
MIIGNILYDIHFLLEYANSSRGSFTEGLSAVGFRDLIGAMSPRAMTSVGDLN